MVTRNILQAGEGEIGCYTCVDLRPAFDVDGLGDSRPWPMS